MCSECGRSKCHVRCPNYIDETIYVCFACGEDIHKGEEYIALDGVHYHKECGYELGAEEILKSFGIVAEIAEEWD